MRAALPFLAVLSAMLLLGGIVLAGACMDERLKRGRLFPTHVGSVAPKFGSAAR